MNTIDKNNKTFSPSVNILRDEGEISNYIITPNAKLVFDQLIEGYGIGTRAYNLVGAYGTGKSAFLATFESEIKNKKNQNFATDNFQDFHFIKFVGEYASFKSIIANFLGIQEKSTSKEIIRVLEKYYQNYEGLLFIVDEFGKFLEYASHHNPEEELYFIQELAEFINDKKRNILFISTLHQDFNQYSFALTTTQKNEWDKVKGRLKEITFNEPVEQLLYLASKKLENQSNLKNLDYETLFNVIKKSGLFPLRDYLTVDISKSLAPLDILSAAILTVALQKYGQNERSLFSFLESNDPYGISDYNRTENIFFNISCVYDYLIHNYYSFLTSKYNPHFSQWTNIKVSLEKAESITNINFANAAKIVKTIGLLNIFSNHSGKIDNEFISHYSTLSLGIDNSEFIIKELTRLRIIKYTNYLNRYVLSLGTDLDIDKALNDAERDIEKPTNIIPYLNEYFKDKYIPAKAVSYQKGTPRFFEFKLVSEPETFIAEGEIDGFIQIIISDKITTKDIKNFSKNNFENSLFVLYENYSSLLETIYENLKLKKIKIDYSEDKIAINELNNLENHNSELINTEININLFSSKNSVKWIYNGEDIEINSFRNLNQKLSEICNIIYFATPIFRNEMMNKTKISSQISLAKKNLMKRLLQDVSEENIGFNPSLFPPEKTIYLSLVKGTGIHRFEEDQYILTNPTDKSFDELWKIGNHFLTTSKYSKRNLNDFIELLLNKPFKLKQGFIDFWLLLFILIKKNDFALFSQDIYIPEITIETLDLISKNPKAFEIKAFDVDGVRLKMFNKYRELLEQTKKDRVSNLTFIETIKPFLKFYRELPEYSKNTKRLGKKSLALRSAIVNSKDPETTFFEDIPSALGTNIIELQNDRNKLSEYLIDLQDSIKEIRGSYSSLLERFEAFIFSDIIGEKASFDQYKLQLQKRFKNIKTHLLKPNQKVFIQRLNSPLDDKNSWLNSLVQVCLGKTLDRISDNEESKLYTIFTDVISELDNLTEISNNDFNDEKEEVLKIEITSFDSGSNKNIIRYPKEKDVEIHNKETEVRNLLGDNTKINIAVLAKLLQDELKK
ncbi:hypothetical protein [Chryseobacterium arthrosphaerae]|uniref:hypothetical protein n=1 Tax=Chryseobacterium arthrosphaerae TaxID=651561 RepID=UPI001F4A92B5|nr:hypothetical protein [Chryseobacterium arthrosphaerae]